MRYGITPVCDRHDLMQKLAEKFTLNQGRKLRFGNFRVTMRDGQPAGIVWESKPKYGMAETDTVAVKLQSGLLLGNASILPNVGAYWTYGSKHANRKVTMIQRLLEQRIPMLPFTVFQQLRLDVNDLVVVDDGPAETVTRRVPNPNFSHSKPESKSNPRMLEETVHFTGAKLFRAGEVHFLFDIDRREIEQKIFNPFVVKLPRPCGTIADAYKALKPEAVLRAEKQGKTVLRQGEWFFVPAQAPSLPRLTRDDRMIAALARSFQSRWGSEPGEIAERVTASLLAFMPEKKAKLLGDRAERIIAKLPKSLELHAGRNRPNEVSMGIEVSKGKFRVSGVVTHSGREHAPLQLNGWFDAVPNTAQESWQITGDID